MLVQHMSFACPISSLSLIPSYISGQLSNKQTEKKPGYHSAKYVLLFNRRHTTASAPSSHQFLIAHHFLLLPLPLFLLFIYCDAPQSNTASDHLYIVYANTVQIATSTTKPPMSGSNQFILPLYDPLGILYVDVTVSWSWYNQHYSARLGSAQLHTYGRTTIWYAIMLVNKTNARVVKTIEQIDDWWERLPATRGRQAMYHTQRWRRWIAGDELYTNSKPVEDHYWAKRYDIYPQLEILYE